MKRPLKGQKKSPLESGLLTLLVKRDSKGGLKDCGVYP